MYGKKIALFLLFCVFLTGAVHAADEGDKNSNQEDVNNNSVNMNSSPGLYIGIAAGFTSNNLFTSEAGRGYTEYKDGEGFEIAAPFRYVIYPWLALQAEVQYIQKNYIWTRTGSYNEIYCNVNNSFIDVPVMVNLSLGSEKLRVFVNAGGYASYWIESKVQGTMREITTDPFNPNRKFYTDFEEKIELNETRDVLFQTGLLAGAGLQMFTDRFNIFIEGRYCYGLTDMRNQDDYGLIIPRINSTIVIRLGVFLSIDTIRAFTGGVKKNETN